MLKSSSLHCEPNIQGKLCRFLSERDCQSQTVRQNLDVGCSFGGGRGVKALLVYNSNKGFEVELLGICLRKQSIWYQQAPTEPNNHPSPKFPLFILLIE